MPPLLTRDVPLWAVTLHNDPITEYDFVVEVLVTTFRKSKLDAEWLAYRSARDGQVIVGEYVKDIGDTRITKAMFSAASAGYPLKLTSQRQ